MSGTKPALVRTYKLVLSYDGTDFHGWQRQPNKRTVQGTLESALLKILRRRISVTGAGRTDAGVHAAGQVASFQAETGMDEPTFLTALNAVLPDDVRVRSLKTVGDDFHARKRARSKVYRYRIFISPRITPFVQRYVLPWPYPLDTSKMERVARLFVREADFSAFSSNRFLQPVRKVTRSDIKVTRREVIYTVEANGFLRYMVRSIVGTLLEVGRGRVAPEQIEALFKGKSRTLASPTAPARGLCLMKVKY